MPNTRLPQEILDHIVDLLHDKPETLKRCCLVSRSWVARARKHLFADIRFRSVEDLRSWKKTFLDSAYSPAHHTRTLFIGCPRAVMTADAEESRWARAFSGISRLDVDNGAWCLKLSTPEVSLAALHNFSSTLKSLHMCPVALPCPQLFDLVRSSPLLEDLTLAGLDESSRNDDNSHVPQIVIPSTSPPFTGSLDLNIVGGVRNTARQLLDLPNGLHFRKLAIWWHCKEDLPWIMQLVVRCSDTLECLDVKCCLSSTFVPTSYWSCDIPSVSSRARGSFGRPFKGKEAQRCGFSARVRITECRMGQHGTPNHHARTSRPSTHLNSSVLLDPLRRQCRRWARSNL